MIYLVEMSATAEAHIFGQAKYIANEKREPESAKRWLERIWDAADSLELSPQRCALAPENNFLPIEVRMLVVASHLMLFTIDNDKKKVKIIGLRHHRALPKPGDLTQG